MACCCKVTKLEEQLNSFNLSERQSALADLLALAKAGEISLPAEKPEVNLHYHTFFSYNAEGWSPSRIAWESKKYGLMATGIVDFDVLDGMDEFIAACELLDLRTDVAMETRVLISEYSDKVITSPNEPGIAYFMMTGVTQLPEAGTEAAATLQAFRDMAGSRNVQMLELINASLGKVQLDYEADVKPLTPAGNATERHMLAAFEQKSKKVFGSDTQAEAEYWAGILGMEVEATKALILDAPSFHDKIRGKLMKFGGVGYIAPGPDTFPSVEKAIEMMNAIGALPTMAYLDGTNAGEADMPDLLALCVKKGVVALNIIPDRNWNIKKAEEKATKVANLRLCMEAARALDLPIIVGTEMNKTGLPFVDDFHAPELVPYVAEFVEGAEFIWGHTLMNRYFGMGFNSAWANVQFKNRKAKNAFYAKLGKALTPSKLAGVKFTTAMSATQVIAAL
ncbi:MAG: hypothetical protein ACYC1M_08280 [Armatimonadota bacterium]